MEECQYGMTTKALKMQAQGNTGGCSHQWSIIGHQRNAVFRSGQNKCLR